jgi:hypothetical protein
MPCCPARAVKLASHAAASSQVGSASWSHPTAPPTQPRGDRQCSLCSRLPCSPGAAPRAGALLCFRWRPGGAPRPFLVAWCIASDGPPSTWVTGSSILARTRGRARSWCKRGMRWISGAFPPRPGCPRGCKYEPGGTGHRHASLATRMGRGMSGICQLLAVHPACLISRGRTALASWGPPRSGRVADAWDCALLIVVATV